MRDHERVRKDGRINGQTGYACNFSPWEEEARRITTTWAI